ncbi:hypothetical protein PG999_003588 [Apiospora kogelbergensis]|uniref:Uncharacterized protein n=1 Tax=Apiospora kogelbergensis TaxID=1337665 RepID=A0AAW0R437_9PEZI
MPAIKALVLSSLAAVAIADGLYVHSNELAAHLAKRRQMPAYGTPAYNCHDNCGQSIIAARGSDPCDDKTFLTDYAVCLSCAGPDNYGIWVYYSGALTNPASSCGLSTTPDTKKTTDVPLAIPAAKASGAVPPLSTTALNGTSTSSVRPSSNSDVMSATSSPIAAGPTTVSPEITSSTVITSPSSSAIVSSTNSAQPTTSAVKNAGASSAVCLKLYTIFLLTSNLLFAFGF